jgi:biopolymer transport protein ExbD
MMLFEVNSQAVTIGLQVRAMRIETDTRAAEDEADTVITDANEAVWPWQTMVAKRDQKIAELERALATEKTRVVVLEAQGVAYRLVMKSMRALSRSPELA